MTDLSSLEKNFRSDLSPIFDRTLLGRVNTQINPERWGEVMEAYEKGNYKYVIIGILHYVDGSLVSKRGNPEKTRFLIPHGSIVVRINLDDDNLTVSAPFLQVPETNNLPLLRRVTEINIRKLGLSEIVLKNNQLEFFFQCPLHLCHPEKMYDVLFEICKYADTYDDMFIEEFGAKWLHEPEIRRFSQQELDSAWQRYRYYLSEAALYYNWFESSRDYESCTQILALALMKIDYYLAPQGFFKTNLEEQIGLLTDDKVPSRDRMHKGLAYLEQLKETPKEKLLENLYMAETFIPLKAHLAPENLNTILRAWANDAHNAFSAGNMIHATLILQDLFLTLLYSYHCPTQLSDNFSAALMRASKKPWGHAADMLWETLVRFMNAG
jgi:hypothetical protein